MKQAVLHDRSSDGAGRGVRPRQFEQVVKKTSNMVVITNQRREIEWVNPAFTEVCGWTLAEVRGKNPGSFMQGPGTNVPDAMRLSALVRKGLPVKGFELLNYKKSGESFWVSLAIEPIRDEQGRVVQYMSVQSDITHRRVQDAELRQQLNRCRESQRIARLGTMEHELSTGRVTCSEEIFRILDTPIQAGNVGYESLMVCTHPDDLASVRQRYEDAINAGGPYESEHRILSKSGCLKWVHLRGLLEGWDDGTPALCRLTVQDITERKLAEQRATEAALREQAARDRIDVLLRVSQQLRPSLQAVLGSAEIVEQTDAVRLSGASRDQLSQMRESAQHALVVIDDIVELARCHAAVVPLDMQAVPLRPLLDEVLVELGTLATARGIACSVIDGGLAASAMADREKLFKVLCELIRNALRRSPPSGEVAIAIGAAAGGRVTLAIQDTGPAIEAGQLHRVFEPFHGVADPAASTPVAGDGLGLAIARSLTCAMHGDIMATSEEGSGSTFTIWLPQAGLQARGEPTLAIA